jgi:predicted outer membrane repeat protein
MEGCFSFWSEVYFKDKYLKILFILPKMKKITLILLIVTRYFPIFSQAVIYVNQSTSGGLNNGTSWENAFINLRVAMTAAQAGDQIWVAQGTYFPTVTQDQSISFELKSDVKYYGSFLGNETSINQRQVTDFPTILSGNIEDPLLKTDNSYHVVYGKNLTKNTLLDGFTIQEGYAVETNIISVIPFGGGLLLEAEDNMECVPIIKNCFFQDNKARNGGAVYCNSSDLQLVSPNFIRCTFLKNYAEISGGGIYKGGSIKFGRPFLIDSCLFELNTAYGSFGGGICLIKNDNEILIQNSEFIKDTAKFGLGGGVFIESNQITENLTLQINNCQFLENYSDEGGGIVAYPFGGISQSHNIKIKKCLFKGNKTGNGNGGGINISGIFDGSQFNLEVSETNFIENTGAIEGSAVYFQGFNNSYCFANFTNCYFKENKTTISSTDFGTVSYRSNYYGGQMKVNFINSLFSFNEGGISGTCSKNNSIETNIFNCTFKKNNKLPIAKNWHQEFDGINTFNKMNIRNCIFKEEVGVSNLFYCIKNGNYSYVDFNISHCSLPFATCNLIDGGETACQEGNIFNIDPDFEDELMEDFRLKKCSPLVNQGNNMVLDSFSITTDLLGLPRIFGDTIDIGAYEVQAPCVSNVKPVNKNELILLNNPIAVNGTILLSSEIELISFNLTTSVGSVENNGVFNPSSIGIYSISAPKTAGVYFLELKKNDKSRQVIKILVIN